MAIYPEQEEKEMSFLDHLEELRWHLIRAALAILVFGVTAFFLKDIVFGQIILGPSRADFFTYRLFCEIGAKFHIEGLCIDKLNFTLMSRTMTGQFTTHIWISLLAGIIVAFPYIFWEVWRFIAPGLLPRERNAANGAVFVVSFLFLLGILFGYYLLAPLSINFLANYQIDERILNQFDLLSYISLLSMMVLSCGIMFQLPVVVFVLSRVGVVTPKMMREYRRHSFIGILIIAAILTPSPDMFSQLLVAVPIYVLYEVSIAIAAVQHRLRQARQQAFEAETPDASWPKNLDQDF